MQFLFSLLFVFVVSAGHSQCIEGDCFTGFGTFKCSCGYVFEGEFLEGQKVYGTLTKEDLIYTGEFKDDVAEGQGKIKFIDSTWYEGSFVNNFPEGYGTFHFADGTTYTGEMFEGIFKGLGVMKYPPSENGQIVYKVGQFANDAINGFGLVADTDRVIFGKFENGVPLGFCTLLINEGETTMGRFKKGKLVEPVEQIDIPIEGFFGAPFKIGKEIYQGEHKGTFLSITVTLDDEQVRLVVFDGETKQFYISKLEDPEFGTAINMEGVIYLAKFNYSTAKIERVKK